MTHAAAEANDPATSTNDPSRSVLHRDCSWTSWPRTKALWISAYNAEPGSASQDALNLLASWAATLEAAGSASPQPGQAH